MKRRESSPELDEAVSTGLRAKHAKHESRKGSMTFYAHSLPGEPPEKWQPLEEHLRNVAELAKEFAEPFGAGEWGYLAGLWHDVGKYSEEFQDYLRGQAEACAETLPGRVDHSSAGAQHAVETVPIIGHLLGYAIAGHHSGLLDGRSEDGNQEKRLKKPLAAWKHGVSELPQPAAPQLPGYVKKALGEHDSFAVAFFARIVFSCLVDADFLDTERAMNPGQAGKRSNSPTLGQVAPRFFRSLEEMEREETGQGINTLRHQIRLDCERAGELPPGFFSLTVPTGGGKTLSSLAFALRHALRPEHDLRRVLYVAPFTTIIEQNADVLRKYLGEDVVLENHCNLDPAKETTAARLASENWDAPVVVTTSVQFYESLFGNKPSRCRKLHRITQSVIILDEAQTLPVEYLKPCLRVLELLVRECGCSVVLCTATQPEVGKRADFDIGLEGVREIIGEPRRLYAQLKRVEIQRIGLQTDAELQDRLLNEKQALCVVNTTKHARLLFQAIKPDEGRFHLSARMCPEHRRNVLTEVRRALAGGETCRVVSTQVVEAGVDLDFPVVYRAMAGLDSIAQAAGRCNRNNRLGQLGRVFVFTSEHALANRYFADTANCAAQVMELYADPLDLDANQHFFKLYYWDQMPHWDAHHILEKFHLEQNRDFPFNFGYAQTAEDFHLIDDAAYCTVVVPWGAEGQALCERLRAMPTPDRETLRQAQRFAVQVHRRVWEHHAVRDIRLIHDNLGILESPETHYDKNTGLNLEAEGPGAYFA